MRDDLKEKIYTLILEEKKTANEIKSELNISNPSLHYYIKKLKEEERIPKDFSFLRTISKKDKEDICYLLLEERNTVQQVAEKLNIGGTKLRKCINELKDEGLLPKYLSTYSSMSAEQKETIRYLAVEQNQTQKEISKKLGVGVNTMVKYVKQLKEEGILPKDFVFKKGGKPFRRGPLTEEEKENIRVMVLEKNYMAIQVADELEISLPTLTKYMLQLKEEGIIPQDFSFAERKRNNKY